MTTNTTDLAAALNECMPLMTGGVTLTECVLSGNGVIAQTDNWEISQVYLCSSRIIGILWAECVRRAWGVTMQGGVEVCVHSHNHTFYATGTDALAFARAFAAAKRAEGGA